MHELLAPIFQAVHFDALPSQSSSDTPAELAAICDGAWAEADAWALFRVVMSRVGEWYEWRDDGPETTFSPDTGALEIRPRVAPIVKVCTRIHNELVRVVDPELHAALQRGGVEPQIYGIRWLRLLFTREFGMPDAMKLWDGLFALAEDVFEIAQWVCVAMLIRVRNDRECGFLLRLHHLTRPQSSRGLHNAADTALALSRGTGTDIAYLPIRDAEVLAHAHLAAPSHPAQVFINAGDRRKRRR